MQPFNDLPDAKDVIQKVDKIKALCRQVFSSGSGKELINELERVYCGGKLYADNDRDTIYFIAQRDLILELKYNALHSINQPIDNGEEINE